jgi:Holliday junction resolvasome RuvABC DNA-binding subunit
MAVVNSSVLTDEDWFNIGKEDAWSRRPQQAPEHDPQAASLYDLGYNEGEITRSLKIVHSQDLLQSTQ